MHGSMASSPIRRSMDYSRRMDPDSQGMAEKVSSREQLAGRGRVLPAVGNQPRAGAQARKRASAPSRHLSEDRSYGWQTCGAAGA